MWLEDSQREGNSSYEVGSLKSLEGDEDLVILTLSDLSDTSCHKLQYVHCAEKLRVWNGATQDCVLHQHDRHISVAHIYLLGRMRR